MQFAEIGLNKTQLAKKRKEEYIRWWRYTHKEIVQNYSKFLYHNSESYRKDKRLTTAYQRFQKGMNVCKRLLNELKDSGYDMEIKIVKENENT